MSKKFVSRRGLCAIALVVLLSPSLLLPVSGFYLSDSDLGQGVLGFLRSLESTIEKKTIWFYRHFGRNVDPSKIDHVRLCNYGDDSNSKFCSPAHNPVVPSQNPNLPKGVSVKNNPLSKQNRSSFTSIPFKCLEDPLYDGIILGPLLQPTRFSSYYYAYYEPLSRIIFGNPCKNNLFSR